MMTHGKVPSVPVAKAWVNRLLLAAAAACFPVLAVAQTTSSAQLPALKQLSIEELLEVDVSLPLRRDERVMDAPAAITVLTGDDIRRQGSVSLADALRTVPGLTVARFATASWVISSRGFASSSANKMLVMIDGRSVYSPLFSGVFWEQQDAMLPDLDRIEVIRGPGAALWGSNAVNGVINVVSKRASETQGTLVTVGAGAEEQFHTSLRYGGRAGAGHYRIYGKAMKKDDARTPTGGDAADGQRFGQAGFRWDLGRKADAFTLQGDISRSRVSLGSRADIEGDGANLLARWVRRPSPTSEFQIQTYYDRTHRFVQAQIEEHRQTFDIDIQHRWPASQRHSLSVGGGYRHSADQTEPSPLLRFDPEDRSTSLTTAFIQDEITLMPKLVAVIGTKIEHNDYTGIEWQPSFRVRWKPDSRHTLWTAASRAVRLPTRFDTDLRILNNGVVIIAGDPDFQSEIVTAYEIGYRVAPLPTVAVSVNGFFNRYDHLRTQELRRTGIVIGNGLNNDSTGVTATIIVQPRAWATLTGSYSGLSHDLALDADSGDLGRGLLETIDPKQHGFVAGRFNLPRRLELDVMTHFIGARPGPRPPVPPTPAYNEASFRIGWRATPRWDLSLIGRDVLHDDHPEFISPTSSQYTRFERAIYARATFAF